MPTVKSKIGKVLIPLLPVNRRTFDILRYELNAWIARTRNALNPLYWFAIWQIQKQRCLSINLGSGGTGKPGWINIELRKYRDTDLCLDIRKPLPFSDCSARRVLAEHVVEHLDFRTDALNLAREVLRVLEPGGTFRVVVPDCERYLHAYVSGSSENWAALSWDLNNMPDDIYTPMHIINHNFHQEGEHLFGYDFETLKYLLKKAGFSEIEKCSFRESRDKDLAIDLEVHRRYSLYIDAVK
jgi:predicted SAM-dependent methyltransferase